MARAGALGLSLASTGALSLFFGLASAPGAALVSGAAPAGVVAHDSAVVNGDMFENRYGPVQVRVTFGADGSITHVDAIQAPSGDRRSVSINEQAVPLLDQEAVAAQNADLHTVSGATYTSRDYERSLQAAIDTARANGLTTIA